MGIGIRLEGLVSVARRAITRDAPDAPAPRTVPPAPAPRHGSADTLERLARDGTQQRVMAQAGAPVAGPPAPRRLNGDELAQRYAPVLVLPPGPYNLPADPQAFIEHSQLRDNGRLWGHGVRGDNTNADPHDDFGAADVAAAGSRQNLDLDDTQRGRLGDPDAPIFYEVDDPQNPTRVTYWFFYAYNDGPKSQDHEGDFERITIELDPVTQQPTQANYSAHNNSHTQPTAWRDVPLDAATGRPLVHVAGGSHASYASPGSHPTELPPLKDHTATDINGDGRIDAGDGAVRIDTADQLRNVKQQPWYPGTGSGLHWGQDGYFEFTSGPQGPSAEKGHFDLPPPRPDAGPPTGTTSTTAPGTTSVPVPVPAGQPPAPQPQQPPTGTTTTTLPP
jgi:hypothetical protein